MEFSLGKYKPKPEEWFKKFIILPVKVEDPRPGRYYVWCEIVWAKFSIGWKGDKYWSFRRLKDGPREELL